MKNIIKKNIVSKSAIILTCLLIIIFIFSSCSECPLQSVPPSFVCQVRGATITQFDPRLEKRDQINPVTGVDSVWYVPVPEYSINSYQFPDDPSSSGSLPNDQRFTSTDTIPIATITNSDNGSFKSALFDYVPTNSSMVGDILVDSVDVTNKVAYLRFFGSLARFPRDFFSENADQFCDSIGKYSRTTLDSIRKNLSVHGQNLSNSINNTYSRSSGFAVIDIKGNVIANAAVPQTDKDSLIAKVKNDAVNIQVTIGQVYFYLARNGKEFAFVIVDISKGSLPPNKNRVTIMFSPLQ